MTLSILATDRRGRPVGLALPASSDFRRLIPGSSILVTASVKRGVGNGIVVQSSRAENPASA